MGLQLHSTRETEMTYEGENERWIALMKRAEPLGAVFLRTADVEIPGFGTVLGLTVEDAEKIIAGRETRQR